MALLEIPKNCDHQKIYASLCKSMFLNNESRSFECILKESQGIPIPKR